MTGIVLREQCLYPQPAGGQTVTSGGASAQSTAVGDYTKVIKLSATQDMYVEFGLNPTATATSMYLAGDKADRYFKIRPGEKVACLQISTAGTLYIHEMTT